MWKVSIGFYLEPLCGFGSDSLSKALISDGFL